MSESVNGEAEVSNTELEGEAVETVEQSEEVANPKEETTEEGAENKVSEAEGDTAIEPTDEEKEKDDEAAKSAHGFRKRLGKQRKAVRNLERDLMEANHRIEQMKGSTDEELSKNEFETDAAFQQRVIEHYSKKAVQQERGSAEQERLQQEINRNNQEIQAERVAEARTRYDDFDKVAEGARNLRLLPDAMQHLNEFTQDSDFGIDILYSLAKDPSIAEKLDEMTPRGREKALVRLETQIEDSLGKAKPQGKAEPQKKPMPAKVQGAKKGVNQADEGMAQYRARRRKEREARKKR